MLTYTLHDKNQELNIEFRGAVDEKSGAVLNNLLNRLQSETIVLNMASVEYFNSIGIKAWVQFVMPLVMGRDCRYINCPPDFISHVNMMPLLASSIPIFSFLSEFICPDCHRSQSEMFDATLDKTILLSSFGEKVCSYCGGHLLPDEDPETVLYFKNT